MTETQGNLSKEYCEFLLSKMLPNCFSPKTPGLTIGPGAVSGQPASPELLSRWEETEGWEDTVTGGRSADVGPCAASFLTYSHVKSTRLTWGQRVWGLRPSTHSPRLDEGLPLSPPPPLADFWAGTPLL